MKVEPYTTSNFAKSQIGMQIDIGILTKKEFDEYCKSVIKKLKINYKIRKKAFKSSLLGTKEK